MEGAELRPLGVGEVLDVAIKLYRLRFASLVKAVALVVAPVAVVSALIQASAGQGDFTTAEPTGEVAFDFGEFWTWLAATLLAGLLGFVASQLATAASFKILSAAYLDEAVDWRESLRFAATRLLPLVWLGLLGGVLVAVGFLLLFLPGVYLWVAWAVATPVLLFEDLRGRAALGRSRQLVRGRWWPTFGAILVGLILSAVVQAILSGIFGAVMGTGGVSGAVAQAGASAVGTALATPFVAGVIAVLYFDLRVRKEGFDLELLARQIESQPPSGA